MRSILRMLPFCVLLAACSSEPSESQLTDAVHEQYDKFNQQAQEAMGRVAPEAQFVVHSVRKVACTPVATPPGYNCDVETDMTTPGIGRNKSIMHIELETIASGWQVKNVF